jgi:hypothetical protein
MCWDVNVTVKYKGNKFAAKRTRVRIPVTFDPPQATFPEVKTWYKGVVGTPMKITPDGREWEIEFPVNLAPGDSVHVGLDFRDSVHISVGDTYRLLARASGKGKEEVGALALRLELAKNAESAPHVIATASRHHSVVVHRFAVAASDVRLDLDQLIGDDEALGGLRWHEIGPTPPYNLAPDSPSFRFDPPQDALVGMKVVLARTEVSDATQEVTIETYIQGPATALRSKDAASEGRDIVSSGSVRLTRTLGAETGAEIRDGPTSDAADDCCLTAIRFRKLYPADMTVRLTTDTGRTVERRFTASKTVRTGYISKTPDNGEDDDQKQAVPGGLGPCVDVDVSIADTASPTLAIAHYHFRLCCADRRVHNGARLVFQDVPTSPLGQVTKLPLLQITGVERAPCPK